ncbi:UNVERIFIED_CONTAM: hypothetical protein GTU68_035616 [Idotea baltica]|nr:hypothetical protein [Idotea baltica]
MLCVLVALMFKS